MSRIVPGVDSLEQHLEQLRCDPERYRPERCPRCGKAGLWCHGHYARKADRGAAGGRSLNPVPIPRFCCPACWATCSRLPACLAPRRWYDWAVQQTVLLGLLAGVSLRSASRLSLPSRHTARRWWGWLRERFEVHAFHLRSRFSSLGLHAGVASFWPACLERFSLAAAMGALERMGVSVP